MTAETANRLVIVDLRTGALIGRVALPSGPEYVASQPGMAIVTSPAAGAVTLLGGDPLRVRKQLHGLGTPTIAAIAPDGQHAYVTNGPSGTLTVIGLSNGRVNSTIPVGAGAHHMTSSPDQQRLWIALGEVARRIVILNTRDLDHPAVIASFTPGFAAHDLSFSPDGRSVWITSASGTDVAAFRASDHRLLFRVPVGPPPQHISFAGADTYLTSGYGSAIEKVDSATGRVLNRARTPYGSFELDAADGYVASASLLNGKLAIFTPALKLLRVVKVAPATRDVEISDP